MAKRARASRSAHRPGGQGPSRSRKSADTPAQQDQPVAAPAPAADIDTAIDTVDAAYTELTIDEAAPAAATPRAPASRRRSRRVKVKSDELEVRAASESVWIREDLRRIGFVSVVLLAALAASWILFVLLDLLRLY